MYVKGMKKYDFVVVGAGAGGLVVASGLARMKRRVLLIERGAFGGDCTNVGCIPSKALIAAAEVAFGVSHAKELGIEGSSTVEASGALNYVRKVVKNVRAKEEPHNLEKLGVDILRGKATFIDPYTLQVDTEKGPQKVRAKKVIIATGSRPRIPIIEGLEGSPYLTNETVFNLEKLPKSLAVIGAGTIGCELAQAFSRLGVKVTLVHPHAQLMDREDPRVSQEMTQVFKEEGMELRAPARTKHVSYNKGAFTLEFEEGAPLVVQHLLIATGRSARLQGLGLENAGVAFSERGIETDCYGQTSQPHIFAVGDVRGKAMFTHIAEKEARALLFNLVTPKWLRYFARKKIFDEKPVPRVTFTNPEVASIGMSAKEAIARWGEGRIAIYDVEFDEVDRAICQKKTVGFVRVVTKKWSSKILGATICSSRAGEMLMEVGMAMHAHIPLRKMAGILHPYPIYNHAIRKAADQWLTKRLFRKK